ncbi:MAG: hypothetical protein ABR506_03965, partial [Candidatus Krumholzibacteriia bacterium]
MTLRRVVLCLPCCLVLLAGCGDRISDDGQAVSDRHLQGAEELLAMPLTADERALMLEDLAESRAAYKDLREHLVENAVAPAVRFDPLAGLDARALAAALDRGPAQWSDPGAVTRPADLEDLAWASLGELAALVRTRQVSCVELAELALARLARHDPQ